MALSNFCRCSEQNQTVHLNSTAYTGEPGLVKAHSGAYRSAASGVQKTSDCGSLLSSHESISKDYKENASPEHKSLTLLSVWYAERRHYMSVKINTCNKD